MAIYRCKNFGGCPIADSRKDIELPPGATATCLTPGCTGPLVEVGGGKVGGKLPPKRRNGENNGPRTPWVWIIAAVVLLALAVGIWKLWPSTPPLTLSVPSAVSGQVGEDLLIPVSVDPATANTTLTLDGNLPAGMVLDSVDKRIHGTPQTPGTSTLVIKAAAPGYRDASANVTITIASFPIASQTPNETPRQIPSETPRQIPSSPPTPPASDLPDLVLTGSNTIGGVDSSSQRGLARDLVKAFCAKQWPGGSLLGEQLIAVQGEDEKDRLILYKLPTGEMRRFLIRPHGSKTAVAALKSTDPRTQADVGMSSSPRPELQDGFVEYVIALDAVAVIVHPDNPVNEMTLDQIKNIFGPNPGTTQWEANHAPINTYGRDIKSGTTESFRVFTGIDKALEAIGRKNAPIPYTGVPAGQDGYEGFEDTSKVIERLSHDVNGIGYVGRAANLPSSVKAISIRPAPGYSAFAPNPSTIRTMDYCMARELFFYTTNNPRPLASDFVRFCLEDAGQQVADEAGFIGFKTDSLLAPPIFGDRAPRALKDAVANCDRIVISFRFRHGASSLDTISAENLKRLIAFLRRPGISNRKMIIVGCSDSIGTQQANTRISRERAETFATLLENQGVENPILQKLGFGRDYLLYDDHGQQDSREAQKNRRVDIYLER
jgi:phosphate transport system substrate-binding protein